MELILSSVDQDLYINPGSWTALSPSSVLFTALINLRLQPSTRKPSQCRPSSTTTTSLVRVLDLLLVPTSSSYVTATGGYKATLHNPNTSAEAKHSAAQKLEELGQTGGSTTHTHTSHTGGLPDQSQHDHRVLGTSASLLWFCLVFQLPRRLTVSWILLCRRVQGYLEPSWRL